MIIYKKNQLITKISDLLLSYKNNNNTGNKYEILTCIQILINNGLDKVQNIPTIYKKILNNKKSLKFNDILGLINLSQLDNIGGTGDISIIFKNKPMEYYSITKYNSKLEKCIINPSPKQYNIEKHNYTELYQTNYNEGLNWIKENMGDIPNKKWKNCRNPYAKIMCEKLALDASNNWDSLTDDIKLGTIQKFLDLDVHFETKTNGIIFTSENGVENIYTWCLHSRLDLSKYLSTISNGIYIYHYITGTDWKETWFLKTQVKYNNGIIEGLSDKNLWTPKPGNPFSSWNCKARLDKIFQMTLLE